MNANEILTDKSASYWLKDAIRTSLNDRDIVDALNDAEVLVQVLRAELAKIQ